MKRELTYADQAKRIQNKYKGRTDKLSMDSMHRELAALEQQQEAVRAQMNLIEPQQMAAWGGPGGYVNQPDNNLLAMGGMIKRADGSYSKRGLWDNIRANKGSGKKPTKQMLEQEKKIKAEYANGGGIDNPGFKALPIEVQNNIKNNIAMGGLTDPSLTPKELKWLATSLRGIESANYLSGQYPDNTMPGGTADRIKKLTKPQKLQLQKYMQNTDVITDIIQSITPNIEFFNPKPKNSKLAYGGMIYAEGGGIHIDPSKKGTFTAAATKHGKSVQGFASQVLANKENYSPAMVKKANFAKNASKWKHAYGGPMGMYFDGTGDEYNGIPYETTGPREEKQFEQEQLGEDKKIAYLNKTLQGTEDGLKYLTPQPTPEFKMPYDQMVRIFDLPSFDELTNNTFNKDEKKFTNSFRKDLTIPDLKYQPTQPTKPTLTIPFIRYPKQELTIPILSYKPNTGNSPFYNNNYKSPFGTGTTMNNSKESEEPKQKFDAGDLAYLGNLASPLIQLFGTKKQPYDYQRVSPELVKYNPNTTADLVRRGSSLPMYLAKQQGLGQGNYLNYLAAISGKAGENIGKANLEGQMKEQIANAGIKNETNRYNAEVQRLQQEAAAKEYAERLKSYVTGAQGLSNALSQYVLDKRAGKESEENKQLMKDYTDKHFSYLDKQLEAMKPKSIYDYSSSPTLPSPTLPSPTLPVSPTFKRSIPTNLELNLPKSKYGLFLNKK